MSLASAVICIIVVCLLVYLVVNKKSVNMNTTPSDISQVQGGVAQPAQDQQPSGDTVTKAGDTIAVNYTGMLADGTVFDSNVDPKFQHVTPFIFTLGAGQVIKGWDDGLVGMKVGDKRHLVIAPEDAYGATGAGNVIPPNATLTFDVELLAIK